jgi:enterochelin esterase-like enzyme
MKQLSLLVLPLVSLLGKLFELLCKLESNHKVYVIMRYSVVVLAVSACTTSIGTNAPAPIQGVSPTTVASVTATPAAPAKVFRSLNEIEIFAPSLKNNLIGEPIERTIYVYLPPSYPSSEKQYPVLYYLPGYGDSAILGFQLPRDMDSLIKSGSVKEMIFVVASGANKLQGSFFVNSPVTGNWEDYIVRDVVSYVDSHFRTLPQADSRGITGHSMGGFGALNIAMHHPEVFGAVYSMSPGLFDEKGLEESFMFSNETMIRAFISYQKDLESLPLEEAQNKMFINSSEEFTLAYGDAFAPNPELPPPYLDYPYKEVAGKLVRDEEVWKKWKSGFGGIAGEAVQYKDNLLKLKGIVVDYGINDENAWIPKGCVYYGEQLSAVGIPVKVESYNGNHSSQLGERIRDHMLPFFSTLLKFE